ncbi:MAG TPA: CoA transferase [Spongiibacteraceae bacterium]|nr:CoA transferase [Spongiibacteraceae bacterium]
MGKTLPNLAIYSANAYANNLLASLGVAARCNSALDAVHPALRYAQSGLLALTGNANAPQICPLPLASCADGVIAALQLLAPDSGLVVDGAALLGERAALAGYTRAGAISAGGSCRLLAVSDGWLALNLARDDDWDLLPAWLEMAPAHSWDDVAAALTVQRLADCVERGRLLGLAVAPMLKPEESTPWYRVEYQCAANAEKIVGGRAPLVIDLSSLWAGPLCSHLLQQLGARVIKVESIHRPDGARRGVSDFYNLLNANKESVALDFSTPQGRAQLRMLCERADIVIEASRPRALRQLGLHAEEIIAANPALTWISITGYGRREAQANWVAFGDDAAVAAGLSSLLYDVHGEPLFCGDAIADPLTGLHAALVAWHSYSNGGGRLIGLALRDVVAYCLQFGAPFTPTVLSARCNDWRAVIEQAQLFDVLPGARRPNFVAADLGADTSTVLQKLGIPC